MTTRLLVAMIACCSATPVLANETTSPAGNKLDPVDKVRTHFGYGPKAIRFKVQATRFKHKINRISKTTLQVIKEKGPTFARRGTRVVLVGTGTVMLKHALQQLIGGDINATDMAIMASGSHLFTLGFSKTKDFGKHVAFGLGTNAVATFFGALSGMFVDGAATLQQVLTSGVVISSSAAASAGVARADNM